uniref:Sugar phosphate transporter domain-containing protein n=1 Tax=Alexandrium catenella TaxID=2925 RepID=A0A7S1L8D5_ALECA
MAGVLAGNLGLIISYIGLNAALNFLNRWALGVHGFSFPLALTAAHMFFNPVLLLPAMLARGIAWSDHGKVMQEQWKGIVVVGLLNGIQIALNNSSLVLMELSLNQVVRAAMPVFVAFLAVVVEKKTPTGEQLMALLLISVGVMLAVYRPGSTFGNDMKGTLLVLSSVAMMALQMSFSGRLGVKLDAVQMTFYTGWLSLIPVAVLVLLLEAPLLLKHCLAHPGSSLAIVFSSCVLAVVYNVVVFQTIRGLSSVGSAVLGNVKVVVILLVSAISMGEMQLWGTRQHAGCLLTFVGAAFYSALKLRKPKGH